MAANTPGTPTPAAPTGGAGSPALPLATGSDDQGGGGIEGFIDRQLKVVADDLENFAAVLSEALDGSEPRFRQSFKTTIEPLSDRIGRLAETLREQDTRELVERTRETVRSHPLAVVGGIAAVAAGLAQVAVMLSRRADRQDVYGSDLTH